MTDKGDKHGTSKQKLSEGKEKVIDSIAIPSSSNDSFSLFCCLLGDVKAFEVTFDKAWNVDFAKDAIVRRLKDLFPSIVPGYLDLYHVNIASKEKSKLREYKPEDQYRLDETEIMGECFPDGYRKGYVQIIVQKPGK